jgi:hypothetical protein
MKGLAPLALLLVLCACGDPTFNNSLDHVGLYTMTTVNGGVLPATLSSNDSIQVEVTGGSVSLEADHSFVERATFRVTEDGVASSEDEVVAGRYTRRGDVFDLDGTDGTALTAIRDGSTLTVVRGSFELTYQK